MNRMAIVLQGGGALGAYEAGVLRRLAKEPDWPPQIVSGVSIGAINAAVLVGARDNDPIEAILNMWDQFCVSPLGWIPGKYASLYGNNNFFRPRTDYYDYYSWNSYYELSPLERFLGKIVDFDKINDERHKKDNRLVVTATNIRTGDITAFDNREQTITVDHIIASGSLPPSFPPRKIGEEYYWDGGLFSNTPLSELIARLPPVESYDNRIFVVEIFPKKKDKIPSNMLEVSDRILEILFANKLEADVHEKDKINKMIREIGGHSKYKLLNNVIVIKPTDGKEDEDEPASGPFDFSEDSIRRRLDRGFEWADDALAEWQRDSDQRDILNIHIQQRVYE